MKHRMSKKTLILSLLVIFLVVPATLILGSRLPGRSYYITSTLVFVELLGLFFASFEARRPQARELVTLAVMAAIAAISRMAFHFIPHFSPITGIILITGVAFGPQAGFLTGAVAAFASNLYIGMGPYLPWQMMGYGIAGVVGGFLFYRRGSFGLKPNLYTLVMAVAGYLTIQLIVGPLLDISGLFTGMSQLSWEALLALLIAGLPVNLIHGSCCFLTILLFSRPLLNKLERLQIKYGMMEDGENGI